jgi:hypothetical protein
MTQTAVLSRRHYSRLLRKGAILVLLVVVLAQGARILGYDAAITDTAERKTRVAHSKPKLQAFYNMFIPPSDKGVTPWVRDLIYEQLTQIAESYAASAFDLVIHIVSMGQVVDDAWIENMCATVIARSSKKSTFQCILGAQYPEGDELKTLTRVHDYCLAHESELVIYFHNKGSFHPSVSNDNWRRSITAALSSDHCLAKMREKDLGESSSCDTCSLLFDPLPGPHYPGNMFAARCSYIAKLLPLSDYQGLHHVVDEWIVWDQMPKQIFAGDGLLVAFLDYTVGRDRYEAEHWMAGHPSIRPCDVATNASLQFWRPDRGKFRDFGPSSPTRFEWSLAPRFPYENRDWYYAYRYELDTLNKRTAAQRKCDYFLLRGLLYKWMTYYNATARNDSWAWTWYPDGNFWQTLVAAVGPLEATHERHCPFHSVTP